MTDPRSAAAHVFVDDLDRLALDPDDRHHLERVLRLRAGDPLTVGDGQGGWRPATFGPEVVPAGDIVRDPAPEPALTVAFALLKGERPELVVQKLTELGVDRIVPMAAERCVVRWEGDRARRHVARLRRVAREAAMQCRRTWLPEVTDVQPFATVASWPGAALAEAGGQPLDLRHPVVLVGPEGGWAPPERAAGLPTVSLGRLVLRSETAAIAAATLLVAQRDGWLRP